MAVDTSRVTPTWTLRTGFPYLDAGRDQPAGARVRPPRRRAPPRPRGPGEHARRVPARASLGYRYLETDVHLTSDGVLLAFHDARPRPGHRRRRRDRRPDRDARSRAALIGGASRSRRWRSCSTQFPDARFNIDLKSDGAVDAARRRSIERSAAWDRVLRRLVLAAPAARVPAARRRPGRRPRAAPVEVAAVAGSLPRRPAAAAARPGAAARCRSRTAAAGCRRRPPALVRRAHAAGVHVHVWTVDDPDEMRAPARPRGRRPDDRPHRPAQGRPRRARTVEGASA